MRSIGSNGNIMMKQHLITLLCTVLLVSTAWAQKQSDADPMHASTFAGIKVRNVGPAFTSGRIADIAVHPEDEHTWYVAVGSGGVWKTENAGTTWTPLFDDQSSYSTGCVTIDPNNPATIWVGTGENVGGRHVGYGDGIYRSTDGGRTWKNMGLEKSEHISEIIVHPENSDVIWVAAQGPLWSKGDERGLYKSTDGGETWKKTLGNAEWTGVTDIAVDPHNPDRMYAATWDRHRTVAAYMGGGPGSGLHRSEDGGETWTELKRGLPGVDMGKIGLAVSPIDPDIVYAAIELQQAEGAVYRSDDRGASWTKMSDAVAGGTGPHYYQELYASPHKKDLIYLCDVRIQVSDDGGRTFRRLNERNKHSDNHEIVFREDDPDYLLIGSDGGIYESFDNAQRWRFIDNLPITQYYKVAVSDHEPFYHIFGGTQDNGSHGGPSRTDKQGGIRNQEWYKTLGADGHQSATEPGNPNIIYAETQQGGLHRVDLKTGDQVYIQPQPREGEPFERYNWDAPILVSPHDPARIYFASQRVWRSENRGDSWTPVSGDLTRNQERIEMPIMGRQQSWNAAWDFNAMSVYNTITSLAESPVEEGLIYAGTDDGIVQVSENGGERWRKIEAADIPGIPKTAFVNDIKADLHDANTVYVAFDNHKYGDFEPYLVKSTDRGKTWKNITNGIPERTLVWRTVQDHEDPNLLFAATEFGLYFTKDGGNNWIQLKGGVPTISFRDITIQRRENDLVAASFGRGFFVLDDISVLREVNEENLQQEGTLYSTRDAWWYTPRMQVGSQGSARYEAENAPYGAVFTYHLSEGLTDMKSERMKKERELAKDGKDVPFPGWEALEAERRQQDPMIWLTIKDDEGKVVRKLNGPSQKGMHRVTWDFTYPSTRPITPGRSSSGSWRSSGFMAMPGNYTVTLSKMVDGEVTQLSGPVEFRVKRLYEGTLEGQSYEEMVAFRENLEELQQRVSACGTILSKSMDRVEAMRVALGRARVAPGKMDKELHDLRLRMLDLDEEMNGMDSKQEIGERTEPTVSTHLWTAYRAMRNTYGPTDMHQQSLALAQKMLTNIENKVKAISQEEVPAMERKLEELGAPWIESMALPGPNRD